MGESRYADDVDSIGNVELTIHARTKGFDKKETKKAVRNLRGDLYWDHQTDTYHLYDWTTGRTIVFEVNGTTAHVVTLYANNNPSGKYDQSRFTELRSV